MKLIKWTIIILIFLIIVYPYVLCYKTDIISSNIIKDILFWIYGLIITAYSSRISDKFKKWFDSKLK